MRRLAFLLPGVILMGYFGLAQAQHATGQFGKFQGDGYYWYKKEPEPAQPKKPEAPPKPIAASGAPPEPKPMSVAWIQANMPKLMETAIDNPTHDNVANYMYAQRIILDKSQRFAEMSADVVSSDAYLDENNRVPLAEYANASFMRELSDNKISVLKSLASKSGIWVFVDKPAKCQICSTYVKNVITSKIVGLEVAYGFKVRVIDVSTPEGLMAAKRLKLKLTPSTVLVAPPSSYYIVSQGVMAATTLQEKILVAARMNGMISEQSIELIQPYSKGLLNQEAFDSTTYETNPSVVMTKFRDKVSGK